MTNETTGTRRTVRRIFSTPNTKAEVNNADDKEIGEKASLSESARGTIDILSVSLFKIVIIKIYPLFIVNLLLIFD